MLTVFVFPYLVQPKPTPCLSPRYSHCNLLLLSTAGRTVGGGPSPKHQDKWGSRSALHSRFTPFSYQHSSFSPRKTVEMCWLQKPRCGKSCGKELCEGRDSACLGLKEEKFTFTCPVSPVLQNTKCQNPWKPDWLIGKFNSNVIFLMSWKSPCDCFSVGEQCFGSAQAW